MSITRKKKFDVLVGLVRRIDAKPDNQDGSSTSIDTPRADGDQVVAGPQARATVASPAALATIYTRHHAEVEQIHKRRTASLELHNTGTKTYRDGLSLLRQTGENELAQPLTPLPDHDDIDRAVGVAVGDLQRLWEAMQACRVAASKRAEVVGHLNERSPFTCVASWKAEAQTLIKRHGHDIVSREAARAKLATNAFNAHLLRRHSLAKTVKKCEEARRLDMRLEALTQRSTTYGRLQDWQAKTVTLLAGQSMSIYSGDRARAEMAIAAFNHQISALRDLREELQKQIKLKQVLIHRAETEQSNHRKKVGEAWSWYLLGDVGAGGLLAIGGMVCVPPILAVIGAIFFETADIGHGCESGCEVGCVGGGMMVVAFYGLFVLLRLVMALNKANSQSQKATHSELICQNARNDLASLQRYTREVEDMLS